MGEFWEEAFKSKQLMWGLAPAAAALIASEVFFKNNFKDILIPGIGYGRNAKPFVDKGMRVTGIEISETAIQLSQQWYGSSLTIYQGSVADMPFDNNQYDAIFTHALIHLLDKDERAKLIDDCYHQLKQNGIMMFTAISKQASTYGQGKPMGQDRFEQFGGVRMFFYDPESIRQEFGAYGLQKVDDITENYPFHIICCRK